VHEHPPSPPVGASADASAFDPVSEDEVTPVSPGVPSPLFATPVSSPTVPPSPTQSIGLHLHKPPPQVHDVAIGSPQTVDSTGQISPSMAHFLPAYPAALVYCPHGTACSPPPSDGAPVSATVPLSVAGPVSLGEPASTAPASG